MKSFQIKRGSSTNFSSITLTAGELAFLIDTGKLYVGDGTNKILINPDGGTATNAQTADKWTTARTITAAGDTTGNVSIDGSGNATFTITVVDDSHNHTISTISNFLSGVLGTVLTGLSTATSTVISATDSVLSALGKLQGQITSHSSNISNPHNTTASQVGLGNVTNESKATMFTNPTFTGTVTVPTPTTGDNTTKSASTAFVTTSISNAINNIDCGKF